MSAISYVKLWKLLIDKHLTKTQLRELSGVSTNIIAKLGKNESISMESLSKICMVLECDIGDIMEFSNGIAGTLKGVSIKND